MNALYPKKRTNTSSNFVANYSTDLNKFVSIYLDRAQDESSRLVYETTIGSMCVNALTRYVIGPGLMPTASPERELVGWTEEQRNTFIAQAESFWRLMTGRNDIDYYERENYYTLQQIAFRNILTVGDVLKHRSYRGKSGGYRPYIQLLSGRWVRNPNGSMDSQKITGGVELDSFGREIGYYIEVVDENLNDTRKTRYVSKYNDKSGLEEYSLIKLCSYEANQVRGVPWLSASKEDIICLESARMGQIVKFITQNLFTAVIESPAESENATTTAERLKNLGLKQEEAYSDREEDLTLGTGNVLQLQPGEKMSTIESQLQAGDYSQFEKTLLSDIGGAIGVPYEMLLQQYNSSYSAARGTITGAEKNFKNIRNEFADKFCQPDWEAIIDYGIRIGAIEAPGYIDGSDIFRQAVLSATWMGPTPVVMDPVKEANAQKLMVENCFTTKEKATREISAMDFEEVAERRAKEMELERNLFSQFAPEEETNNNEEKEDKDEE